MCGFFLLWWSPLPCEKTGYQMAGITGTSMRPPWMTLSKKFCVQVYTVCTLCRDITQKHTCLYLTCHLQYFRARSPLPSSSKADTSWATWEGEVCSWRHLINISKAFFWGVSREGVPAMSSRVDFFKPSLIPIFVHTEQISRERSKSSELDGRAVKKITTVKKLCIAIL